MQIYQPVPVSETVEALRDLVAKRMFISVTGVPLVATWCIWCSSIALGDTCPMAVSCATCGAEPGQPCTSPKTQSAVTSHGERVLAADARDQLREQLCDPTLPAKWAPDAQRASN